jgi:hypothetical protein
MALTQRIELPLQGAARGIAAGVVVAKNASHRQRKLGKTAGDARLTIAQITHHQKRIRLEKAQQALVGAVPLTMQVTGDGDAELGQAAA